MQRTNIHSSPVSAILIALLSLPLFGDTGNSYDAPSSEPRHLHVFGQHVYFSANDGIHGRELWRVDFSGNAELVRDMTPGPVEVDIDNFREFKGHLYFRVARGINGGDLWRTDGTEQGTRQVYTFVTSADAMGVRTLVAADAERLYFVVGPNRGTGDLWSTDGTSTGTYPVEPGGQSTALAVDSYSGVVLGGVHYLGARDDKQSGLWRTNGVAGSTHVVVGMRKIPSYFWVLDERRFVFSGEDEVHGHEIWISEGTAETTRLLKDIYPGPETSDPRAGGRILTPEGKPLVLFSATNPETGRELWETDGTPEGTRLRADLFAGAGSSSPSPVAVVGEDHYLIAVGDGLGKELWRYKADSGTYDVLGDLLPGPAGSEPYALCTVAGQVYFSALTEGKGEELWVAGPRRAGARLFADINPGPGHSFPYYTVEIPGGIVTVATDPAHGRELWFAVGYAPELRLLADIYTDTSVNPSSYPEGFTSAGELLYFTANDIEHGTELWRTEGTEEGTILLKDIYSGSASSTPAELTAVGTLLYFTAEDGVRGTELWRSDGTTAGTSLVQDIHPDGSANPRNLTVFKDTLLFSAFEPTDGEEIWILEPNSQPKNLKDINVGPASSSPSDFFVWRDHLYFQADDGVRGRELWRTNGTVEGTDLVRDIVAAPFEKISVHTPRAHQGVLYFASDLDGRGRELWKLDEDQNAIRLVRDIVSADAYDVVNRNSDDPVANR